MSRVPAAADVVVVGAGVFGASVAHQLARRGAAVVVLDRAPRPGAGATGRSGGMVRAYDPDPAVRELAGPSLAAYRDPSRWAAGHAPLRAVGAVTIAAPDREAALRAAAGRIAGAYVVADADATAGVRLAGGVALVEPGAGWVAPAEVAADWLAQARADGAAVCLGVGVRAVTDGGGHPVVHTDAGTLGAGAVIAAVGPWAADPVPGLRPAAPVRSRSIQVTVVERRPPAPPHPTVVDLRTGAYARPVEPDRTLLGLPYLAWDQPFDAPPDAAHERATVTALTAHFPWLGGAARVGSVRAADAYGPAGDGALLAPTGLPRVWSVRAWNGGGVKTAPEAGRRIADAFAAADARPAALLLAEGER